MHDESVVVGEQLETAELQAGPGELSWAIYQFSGVEQGSAIGEVLTTLAGEAGTVFVALSDFGLMRWDWYSADYTPGGDQKARPIITPDQDANYVSPLGHVYVAVAKWDGGAADLTFIWLGTGLVLDYMTEVSASNGGIPDGVEISWEAYEGATGYLIKYQTWPGPSEISVLAEAGPEETSFVHGPLTTPGMEPEPHSLYNYRVQAKVSDKLYTQSQSDTGWAGLASPTGFSCSYRGDTEKVVLRWEAVDGATGYNIYRDQQLLNMVGDVEIYEDHSLLGQADYAEHGYSVFPLNGVGEGPGSTGGVGALLQVESFLLLGILDHLGEFDGEVIDGLPYFIYRDGTSNSPTIAAGEVQLPDSPGDFSVYTAKEGSVGNAYNRLTVSAGFPALAYIDSIAGTVAFGYADTLTPNSEEDWSIANALDFNVGFNSLALVEIEDKPALTFADGVQEILYLRPADATPQGPQDWTATEIEPGAGGGTSVSLVAFDGRPAIAFVDSSGQLIFAHAASSDPQTPEDWPQTVIGPAEVDGACCLSLNLGRPVIAYQDDHALGGFSDLHVAQAQVDMPASSEDWAVMELYGQFGSDCGEQVEVIQVGGRVGIFHEVQNSLVTSRQVVYHRSRIFWPEESTDWDTATLASDSGFVSGGHAAVNLFSGGFGMMFNKQDGGGDYDLHWLYEVLPDE